MKNSGKWLLALFLMSLPTFTFAAEVALCALPKANIPLSNESNSQCIQMIKSAAQVIKATHANLSLINDTAIPAQLNVGAVYLQPITMAPADMMLPRKQADIHLEVDIHAKQHLKARGFAPGDWLPNAIVNYSIQKIGDAKPLPCGGMSHMHEMHTNCQLMPMAASDGVHYGDNIKLDGLGFYIVTIEAHSDPHFGWHTDTESKVLGTEFVDWHFTQRYLFKWTGIGKIGGY